MRGSTNAVPAAGGGLKVIASGQLAGASSATTVTLPQPAQLVIVCAYSAEDVGNSAVIVRGGSFSDYIMMTNGGKGEYRLSQDGLTITYQALTSGAYYVAFG